MDYKTEMKALENLIAQDEAKKMAAQDKYYTGQTISGIISPLITGKEGRKSIEESFTTPSTMEMQNIADRRKELLGKYKTAQGLQLGRNKEDRDFERQKKLLGLKAEYDKAKEMRKPPKLSSGQQALERNFAKTYNTYVNEGGYNTMQNNIKKMEDVVKQLESGDVQTGGLRAMLPTSGTSGGYLNPKLTAVREQLESAIQGTLKPILGAQFARIEGEMIFKRAFNDALPNDVNIKKIKYEIDGLKNRAKAYQKAVDYWDSHEQSLVGFKGNIEGAPTPQTPEDVLKSPDSNIAGAIDKGINAIGNAMLPSANASEGLQPGMVEDGYRFKGGDPSKQENWEKI